MYFAESPSNLVYHYVSLETSVCILLSARVNVLEKSLPNNDCTHLSNILFTYCSELFNVPSYCAFQRKYSLHLQGRTLICFASSVL
jgi:hypothetical protein